MLLSLRIENFAIVSHLELDFSAGMTAFTGETGAGKSIMIDALMLALGERADAAVIRQGADKCDITACFLIEEASSPAQWLDQHDLTYEQGEIFLRRVISREGRSKSYINAQPFPLQKVKELSEMLVDIHGQHQHQTLLHSATHRQQLDQFAKHPLLIKAVNEAYQHYLSSEALLEQLKEDANSLQEIDILEANLAELAQLSPQEDEMAQLHQEHQLLHHAKDYLTNSQHVIDLLSADDTPNITQALNQALLLLDHLPKDHTAIKNAFEMLNSALIQCDEAINEMKQFSHEVQLDPERLLAVEERMSLLHQVARKFHVDVHQLPAHLLHLQQHLQQLNNIEVRLKQQQVQCLQDKNAYEIAALKLRASRQSAAKVLAKEITKRIQQLGMPKGYIDVKITPIEKMQAHGLDKVEYIVCTNPGMLPDTLIKVVSGGELSRIGLAIHVITAQRGATPTLLFDEVDVGIGGATSALVGQLLRHLGERLQVFCVTHQAQVAASAHHHFVVEKYSDNQQTFSSVKILTDSEKIAEIARMLGGLTITEQTRSHAKELLKQASETLADIF